MSTAAKTTAGPLGATWLTQVRQDGEFVRRPTQFRGAVAADGSTPFLPESGRYHLYVSLACPWAHRVLIVRALEGLEEHVSVDVVDWHLAEEGWTLRAESPGATRDSVNGRERLRDVYELAAPGYVGSYTVPVLWDRQQRTIVNNESSEILRMLDTEFRGLARHPEVELRPALLAARIDAINDWVYPLINDGVYRAGFARSQAAYERAARGVFEGLARVEELLSRQRYLAGARLTEADVRLFTTLVRFDLVYHQHFKCSLRRLVDYPNTWAYVRDLYSMPAFSGTTDFEHIRRHYFGSHASINPLGIVPLAPELDFHAPHDRARFPSEAFAAHAA
jgi:putative glutathione S-transferase